MITFAQQIANTLLKYEAFSINLALEETASRLHLDDDGRSILGGSDLQSQRTLQTNGNRPSRRQTVGGGFQTV